MNRSQLFNKMLEYNPDWFKVLLPYIDGFSPYLPDNKNLNPDFSGLSIENARYCIVGETYGFTNDYVSGSSYCYECNWYAVQFEYLYYQDLDNRHKQNADHLSSFRYNLEQFYTHIEQVHRIKQTC